MCLLNIKSPKESDSSNNSSFNVNIKTLTINHETTEVMNPN